MLKADTIILARHIDKGTKVAFSHHPDYPNLESPNSRLSIMIITEDTSDAEYQIRSYEPGKIKINEKVYSRSIIISSHHLITDWGPQSLNEFESKHVTPILELKPEVILLGTGKHFIMPAPKIVSLFNQQKIGFEYMDTRAACRTYMALVSENRNVVAALLIN